MGRQNSPWATVQHMGQHMVQHMVQHTVQRMSLQHMAQHMIQHTHCPPRTLHPSSSLTRATIALTMAEGTEQVLEGTKPMTCAETSDTEYSCADPCDSSSADVRLRM